MSKELEKAAEEYAEKHGFRVPYDGTNSFYDEVAIKTSKEAFIAGANWQTRNTIITDNSMKATTKN